MISLTDSEVIYLTYLELIGDEISAWLLPFDVSAARDISLSYLPSFNPAANTFRSPCSLRPRHFEWPARLPMLDLTIRGSLCINMTTSRSTFLTRQRLSYTQLSQSSNLRCSKMAETTLPNNPQSRGPEGPVTIDYR